MLSHIAFNSTKFQVWKFEIGSTLLFKEILSFITFEKCRTLHSLNKKEWNCIFFKYACYKYWCVYLFCSIGSTFVNGWYIFYDICHVRWEITEFSVFRGNCCRRKWKIDGTKCLHQIMWNNETKFLVPLRC